jgi:hypothetical protein
MSRSMMNFRNVMAFSAEWLWKNGTSKPSVSQPLTNGMAPRLRLFDISHCPVGKVTLGIPQSGSDRNFA